jgi:hypothetical protein
LKCSRGISSHQEKEREEEIFDSKTLGQFEIGLSEGSGEN